MNVIVAGSRDITDDTIVFWAINSSGFNVSKVLSGRCYGVDRCGERWAHRKRIPVDYYSDTPGGRDERHKQMCKEADALVAVWDGKSPGTKAMILEARRQRLKIYVLRIDRDGKT
jgi:hypothetical protein